MLPSSLAPISIPSRSSMRRSGMPGTRRRALKTAPGSEDDDQRTITGSCDHVPCHAEDGNGWMTRLGRRPVGRCQDTSSLRIAADIRGKTYQAAARQRVFVSLLKCERGADSSPFFLPEKGVVSSNRHFPRRSTRRSINLCETTGSRYRQVARQSTPMPLPVFSSGPACRRMMQAEHPRRALINCEILRRCSMAGRRLRVSQLTLRYLLLPTFCC